MVEEITKYRCGVCKGEQDYNKEGLRLAQECEALGEAPEVLPEGTVLITRVNDIGLLRACILGKRLGIKRGGAEKHLSVYNTLTVEYCKERGIEEGPLYENMPTHIDEEERIGWDSNIITRRATKSEIEMICGSPELSRFRESGNFSEILEKLAPAPQQPTS